MMIYATDAHSLIWFLTKDPKLGNNALLAFRSADEGKSLIIIPSIIIAEIMHIVRYKQVEIKFADLLEKISESRNYIIYNLDLEVLLETEKYAKLRDMHDRIIVATAKLCNAKLITKDRKIRDSGYIETIW